MLGWGSLAVLLLPGAKNQPRPISRGGTLYRGSEIRLMGNGVLINGKEME